MLRDCDYVDFPNPAWKIVFRIESICDGKGWRDVIAEQRLTVAVFDPAGQFAIFPNKQLPKQIGLVVSRDERTGMVKHVYLAPPDQVAIKW